MFLPSSHCVGRHAGSNLDGARMKPARVFAGLLCIALSFGLVLLLGLGMFDPTRDAAASANGSVTPVLIALMPSVSVGLAVFALGVWLISTGRKR